MLCYFLLFLAITFCYIYYIVYIIAYLKSQRFCVFIIFQHHKLTTCLKQTHASCLQASTLPQNCQLCPCLAWQVRPSLEASVRSPHQDPFNEIYRYFKIIVRLQLFWYYYLLTFLKWISNPYYLLWLQRKIGSCGLAKIHAELKKYSCTLVQCSKKSQECFQLVICLL